MANGKRALVTGSSRGIGRAIAIALAADGYEVLIHCAGNMQKAEETRKLIERAGHSATVIQADLCNLDQTARLVAEMGDIDALVLNASVQYRNKWEQISQDECRDQLNCNFISSLLLVQGLCPICGQPVGDGL